MHGEAGFEAHRVRLGAWSVFTEKGRGLDDEACQAGFTPGAAPKQTRKLSAEYGHDEGR